MCHRISLSHFPQPHLLEPALVRDVHETFLAEAETEALGDRSEAETEANNKKMCIFKLFKTWKLFEMYNLTWNGIIC